MQDYNILRMQYKEKLKDEAAKILSEHSCLKMKALVRILKEKGFNTTPWQMAYLMRADNRFILDHRNWRLRKR